jgi:hypothetical protein
MDKDLDRLLDTYVVADADEALLARVLAAVEIAEFLPSTHIASTQVQEQNASRTLLAYAVILLLIGLSGFGLGVRQTRDSGQKIEVASGTNTSMTSANSQAVQYRNGYADRIILGPDSPYEIML